MTLYHRSVSKILVSKIIDISVTEICCLTLGGKVKQAPACFIFVNENQSMEDDAFSYIMLRFGILQMLKPGLTFLS